MADKYNAYTSAAAYSGLGSRPDFHDRFRNIEQRSDHIATWLKNLEARKADREQRQAERRSFEHDLKVGSILYASWGYDQTNIDFYEVISIYPLPQR